MAFKMRDKVEKKPEKKPDKLLSPPTLSLHAAEEDTKNTEQWWQERMVSGLDLVRPAAWIPRINSLDFGNKIAETLLAVAYPREAYTNFLLPFLRMRISRRLSFWIEPIASEKILAELTRRMESLQASMASASRRGKMSDPYSPIALNDAMQLRENLAQQTIKMYDFTFMATIWVEGSDSEATELLRQNVEEFQRQAAGSLWIFRPATFEQASGFLSTLPIGQPGISRPRMLDSDSVSATFPFIGGDAFERHGQYFGENLLTRKPVLLNISDTKLYPAPHMVVIAKTRSGKSMTIKNYLLQRMMDPEVDVMILDPSPPIDYKAVSTVMGSYIRFKTGTDQRLNICEIVYPANVGELEEEDQKLLSKKIDYLKTLLAFMVHPRENGTWSEEESPWIEPVIREVYDRFGITDNPMSLIDPVGSLNMSKTALKPMPILEDLQQAFLKHESPEMRKVGALLEPWIHGTLSMFNGQTNLVSTNNVSALDQRWITFNIEGIVSNHPELEQVVHFVIGEFIAQRMLASHRKKIVVLDEAHILFGNRDTALWVSRLYRMAGKMNAQIILITQSITDMIGDAGNGQVIPGAEFAQKCLTNTYLRFLMHQDQDEEIRILQRQFGLTDAETRWLKEAQQGDGIIVSHRFHILTHVIIPPNIYQLTTSNPDDLIPRRQASNY